MIDSVSGTVSPWLTLVPLADIEGGDIYYYIACSTIMMPYRRHEATLCVSIFQVCQSRLNMLCNHQGDSLPYLHFDEFACTRLLNPLQPQ